MTGFELESEDDDATPIETDAADPIALRDDEQIRVLIISRVPGLEPEQKRYIGQGIADLVGGIVRPTGDVFIQFLAQMAVTPEEQP